MFVNRLRRNMRLQSDPTIIYGIVGGQGRLGRPIRRSEIQAKTAFNTYQIDGLPPTPIANPGKESIIAVLRPASTDELYFVADGTGGHVFSKTLAEHNVNVRRYRQIEKAERANAAAIAAAEAAKTEEQAQQAEGAEQEDEPQAVSEPTSEQTAGNGDQTASVAGGGDELPVAESDQAQSAGGAEIEAVKVPKPLNRPALN